MGATETMREMRVTAATNIHNDILRAYIGWGCLPMLYYLVNFFLLRVNRFIKDKNEENAWRYFAIASLYLFINFFDNMLSAEIASCRRLEKPQRNADNVTMDGQNGLTEKLRF